jgi:putative membrane protein
LSDGRRHRPAALTMGLRPTNGEAVMALMDGMMGMGWWMVLWGLVGLAVLVLVVLAIVRLIRSDSSRAGIPAGEDPAQVELRRRYAAGQIDQEEYLRRLDDLRRP